MARKRYCTKSLDLRLDIEAGGKKMTVKFNCNDVLNKIRYVDVKDEKVQKALESNKFFDNYFYLSPLKWEDQVSTPVKEQESEAPDEEEAETADDTSELTDKTVKNGTLAKEWLHKEHGISLNKLMNKDMMKNEAIEIGFNLIFESDNK